MSDHPNHSIHSKLPEVGLSIFAVMSQLAAEHGALNLSQGFPDFDCPPELAERVAHHLRAGHNQYAPMPGLPALAEAIAVKTEALYGAVVDPAEEVTVTCGATEALFAAITALVGRDDEVILFDPAYDAYDPAVRLAGGIPVHLPLAYPDYRVDWDRVRASITPRTRMLVVNSPHNPTGAVFGPDDLDALEALVARFDLLLLSDEVYEHIVFDGHPHQSLLSRPALRERALVMSSFGKTYHTTGWKIGYCIAPPALTRELRRVHQFVTYCVATPIQHAYADFLSDREHYLSLPAFYQEKRDRFRTEVTDSAFKILPCHGTYFQLLDYSALSDEDDVTFSRRLTREAGIASIPVSVFYAEPPGDRVLRFCFAKGEETLAEAGTILRGIRA